mmetsp:Transcript_20885/g.47408  ORF Transcript_20885/g.47408 Transcript_20885/m.47408 type:complete len:530 (+) Transcript_20885:149-1738(+)
MKLLLIIILVLIHHIAAQTPGFFASNGFGKIFNSSSRPNGEYFRGTTYIAYQGPHEDPYVVAYIHSTQKWIGPIKAGVNQLGDLSNDQNKHDDHGKPAMVMSSDGYINIFYGGHGGCPEVEGISNIYGKGCGSGKLLHARSLLPENIEQFEEPKSNVSPFGTYASTVKIYNGDIYLFYRHGTHVASWVYQKSNNGGATFKDAVPVLKHKIYSDYADSWYGQFFTYQQDVDSVKRNVIGCSFIYHYHALGSAGDDHRIRRNAYFAEFHTDTREWKAIDGKVIESPITKTIADQYLLVYESGNDIYDKSSGTYNIDGEPVLLFKPYPSPTSKVGPSLDIWKWEIVNKQWTGPITLTYQTLQTAFFEKSPEKQNRMRIIGSKGSAVSAFDSYDNGTTWEEQPDIMSSRYDKKLMNAEICNAHPDATEIIAEKLPKTNFWYLYLRGDNGIVPREGSGEVAGLGCRDCWGENEFMDISSSPLEVCEDRKEFRFNNDSSLKCKKLKNKCNKWDKKGRLVKNHCPSTCDFCQSKKR